MIANDSDLQNYLSELQTTVIMNPVDLSERMNASEMNATEQDIYNLLNILYTRVRILEDIKDYMRTHILSEIANKKKDFQKVISEIEKNTDTYTTDKKKGVVIPYTWSHDTVTDRDGTELSPLIYNDTRIYPQGYTAYHTNISTINHNSMDIPFDLKKNEQSGYYEVRYLKDKPDVVDDAVTILFKEPRVINYVECHVYNADVSASYLTETNDTIDIPLNQYIEPITAYGLTLELVSDVYEEISQNVDKKETAVDSFSKFNQTKNILLDTESDTASNIADNKFKNTIEDFSRKVDSQ